MEAGQPLFSMVNEHLRTAHNREDLKTQTIWGGGVAKIKPLIALCGDYGWKRRDSSPVLDLGVIDGPSVCL